MLKKGHVLSSTPRRYTVLEQVGEGAKGIVYEVKDEWGETFALKLLKSEFTGTRAETRFMKEQTFCWLNDHPNIVRVRDFGVAMRGKKRVPYYVARRYGESLRTLIRRGIDPNETVVDFLQVVDGVAEAHRKLVVHRDLKPENIFYDRSTNRFVVGDFGIAHFYDHFGFDDRKTSAGEILANRSYAAPEQGHKGAQVGSAADIFALGRILNEMFTGQIPVGTNYIKIGDVYPLSAHLDDVVTSMMRQDATLRPTIEEVREGLSKGPPHSVTNETIRQKADAASTLGGPRERERTLLKIFELAMQNGLDESALEVARKLTHPRTRESCFWKVFEARLSDGDTVGAQVAKDELVMPRNIESAKIMLIEVT